MSDDLLRELDKYGGPIPADPEAWEWYECNLMQRAAARIRELQSRLATAEADALEKAAQEVECGCEGACLSPGNCSRDDAAAIRALKPKEQE